MDRRPFIVVAVIGIHGLAFLALQAGLQRRDEPIVVPVSVLSELIEPAPRERALPQVAPPARTRPDQTASPETPSVQRPSPEIVKAPTPQAPPTLQPPREVISRAEPMASAPAIGALPVGPTVAEPTSEVPKAPPQVEQPSTNATYLNNPRPPYPSMSRRLGEQGTVVVHVYIGVDGRATQAQIASSSGYERLDQVARQTVLGWRFVPGRRGGVPEGMWFDVPIRFDLRSD